MAEIRPAADSAEMRNSGHMFTINSPVGTAVWK